MSDQVTIDEAKQCPRCGQVGKEVRKDAGPKRSTVYTFNCENPNCRWYGTGWVVQVNADGTIPTRGNGPKEFLDMSPGTQAMAQRYLEDLEREK